MVFKKEKQNPPPPKPEEESSEEEEEEVEEEEEEEEEEVEEKEVEEEGHQEKPQPSSSSETESESDEDDDQSTSHPTQPSVKNPSVQRQATPPPEAVPNSGSEEEETESEEEEEEEEADPASESPRSATASAYTVKPITTVPVNSKVSKPTPKRPLESSKNDIKGSTDRKKAKTGEENDKKGKSAVPAGRVWSEENEIVVLQGMINYQKQKGPFRSADTGVFYEFIKGKLWDGVTKTQIADKLKRLKGKYLTNVKKGKNGQDPSFSKPHEKKAYELSKQIWGVGGESNGNEEKAKTKVDIGKGKKVSNAGSETKRVEDNSKVKSDNPKGKKGSNDGSALMDVDEDAKQDLVKDELKDDDEEDFLSEFPTLSKSFDAEMGFLKDNLHLIGSQKARDLEEQWKQLHLEEMDVLAKRLNLKHVQIKLVLDAMKKQ